MVINQETNFQYQDFKSLNKRILEIASAHTIMIYNDIISVYMAYIKYIQYVCMVDIVYGIYNTQCIYSTCCVLCVCMYVYICAYTHASRVFNNKYTGVSFLFSKSPNV